MSKNFNQTEEIGNATVSDAGQENWKIKQTIQALDKAIQKKLLISNMIIFASELAVIFVIASLYRQCYGKHVMIFLSLLIGLFLLMLLAAHRIWERMAYQPSPSSDAYQTYWAYHTGKLTNQRKLVFIYLLTYAFIQ